jgi:pimeloyl-ACP methyl ester carboxylesterase
LILKVFANSLSFLSFKSQQATISKLSLLNNIPTLIIWGAQDKLLSIKNFERWKLQIPNAKFIVLDDVGHFVAEEDPDNFKAILYKFIKNI